MERFGLIAFPAKGSLSPRLFEAAYHGRLPYDLMDEADFSRAFESFLSGPYRAVNISAPHKMSAAEAADRRSAEVKRIGAANILVKEEGGIVAYNSDYLAVKSLCNIPGIRTAAVIGFGGAGKAALAAVQDLGLETAVFRHNETDSGIKADLVVYTLPKAVEGIGKFECKVLLEANYRSPACSSLKCRYIGGREWLKEQAALGYALMTGEQPDLPAIRSLEI